jgi:hypothetical protein
MYTRSFLTSTIISPQRAVPHPASPRGEPLVS